MSCEHPYPRFFYDLVRIKAPSSGFEPYRENLPREADNYDRWCERCQRVHPHFTLTREHYDRIISEGAQKLADRIDAEIAAKVYGGGE